MAKTMTDAKTTLDALTQRSDTCLMRKAPKRRERVKTPGGFHTWPSASTLQIESAGDHDIDWIWNE